MYICIDPLEGCLIRHKCKIIAGLNVTCFIPGCGMKARTSHVNTLGPTGNIAALS